MNKSDLVDAVTKLSGLSKTDAAKALDAITDTISQTLAKGDDVRLTGFGRFSTSARKATNGRNPRTGETMAIAASTRPRFKAGLGLKGAVNR